jgi:hypothetical protein
MLEQFRRFSALERSARGIFLRAVVLLPLVAMSLRWRGFKTTHAMLQAYPSNANPQQDGVVVKSATVMTARMVNAADRHGLIHPSCLAKSLTLWWLLARQGISSQLRIGTRKEGDKFQAHAWVEHDGAALNEPEAHHQHYAAFDEVFPSLPTEDRES